MSDFEKWWDTHRHEWELTDEEEGLAILAGELAWDYQQTKIDNVVEAFNDAIITFEIILPRINESDKPSIKGNIAYYKSVLAGLKED